MNSEVIILGRSSYPLDHKRARLYGEIGEWLAREGFDAITGACPGIAYFVGKKVLENGGHVLGYSPAHCLKAHIDMYHFPTDGCSRISYENRKLLTNESYFCRSVRMFLCNKEDIIISFNGGRGTFSELCMAYFMSRTIILATFTGGATAIFFYLSKLFRLINLKYGANVKKASSLAELQQILLHLREVSDNDIKQ